MDNSSLIILAVIVVGAIFVINSLIGRSDRKSKQTEFYHYKHKDHLMTKSENDFFKMLVNVAGDRYYVFPQVHLSAILDHKVSGQNWKPAFQHINGKSVDFVLCDKGTLAPTYAVELDDLSHEAESRIKRDEEVDRIFKAADLPLLRFRDYKNLSQENIVQSFFEAHSQRSLQH